MNVTELKAFYETNLGKFTCRKLRAKLIALWPEIAGEKILGLGFALPYLPIFSYGNNCLAFMPSTIGAMKLEEASPVVMVDCASLPAKNDYFDRAIIIHGIENAALPEKLFEEIWRVLKPNGKILLIAPNENGVWLRGQSPFNKSRAYSRNKLREYLLFNKFVPRRFSRALFFIPTRFRILNRIAELFGSIFMRPFSGVLIIEAQKLIFGVGGRPIKIAPSRWEKLLKPKPAAAT